MMGERSAIKLIGLAGQAGCGKDTVAQILCGTQEFRRIALADPIRRGISEMFGLHESYLTNRDLKEIPHKDLCGKTPRYLMQSLGTEWGRNCIDLSVWLKIAQREIDYISGIAESQTTYIRGIVVSDVRFEGEAKWIRDQGGVVWHIKRPNNPYQIDQTHESETQLAIDELDEIIINDGDTDDLFEDVALLLAMASEEQAAC
jgi:uncharacterized protein involved in tellurium resistance